MEDQLLKVFARCILDKFKSLRATELKPYQKLRLRKSITEDIRTCGALIFPELKAPDVSKAAQEEANRLGVDLRSQNWHTQGKFDRGRKTFHLEHVCPIAVIHNECKNAASEDDIVNILKTRLRIAWILKREDGELTRLGYRSERPDPDAAYRHAGIELMKMELELP